MEKIFFFMEGPGFLVMPFQFSYTKSNEFYYFMQPVGLFRTNFKKELLHFFLTC